MSFVIDASAAAEYLLRTELGLRIEGIISGAALLAPELLDAEILAILRRAVFRRVLTEERAQFAVNDLVSWPLERIPHRQLVETAWHYRDNVSAYDAFYVAAAEKLGLTLLTADGPLSRAPIPGIGIVNVRLGS
jgi:predicted nucleic acid-binding protein